MLNTSVILKKILLALVFIFMFIHMIYNEFNFVRIPNLKGYITYPKKPLLNDSTWFSGTYQVQQDNYMNSMFGFRSLYVRLNNQLDFLIFHKVNASGVVLGKENYLYEEKYIKAYNGVDFMGQDSIDLILKQIKFVSDELAKRKKHLIIIFAPGKASFYPEFIPNTFSKVNDSTNYKFLSTGVKKLKINVIDFNKWFVENRYKSKYPLYPKYANHWSNYGAVLAADSIINYIQRLKQIDMPNLIYNKVDVKKPFGIDYDIADGLNLLFKLKSVNMAYPRISTEDVTGKIKPKVLVVGDSFYWGMYYFGISNSFQNDHFWYYNEQVYPESNKKTVMVKDLDFENEIIKHNVFIVMASELNLHALGWGFFKNAEVFFKTKGRTTLNNIKQKIKNDKIWMLDIYRKANERRISADSMITIDAIWAIEQNEKN